jgi:branched-chain amino acid transport system substrate-binding protein
MAPLGPAQAAGIQLAVDDVNAAGGVLGQSVLVLEGDSGDATSQVASQSVDRALEGKVTAIIGATGSAVTSMVLDKVVGAGVVDLSFADSSSALTDRSDRGLFFRTAPPDTFEAEVLAASVWRAGHRSVDVVHSPEATGAPLLAAFVSQFQTLGGTVRAQISYDGRSPDPVGVAGRLSASDAAALVVLGAVDLRPLVDALEQAGAGPSSRPLYVSALTLSGQLTAGLSTRAAAGVVGLRPGGPVPAAFASRVLAHDTDLTDVGMAPQAYDAVVLLALAAEVSGDTTGKAIAGALRGVTTGPNPCSTYADCLRLVHAGQAIAYQGVGGPVALTATGEPVEATLGLFGYAAPGRVAPTALGHTSARVG